MLFFVLRDYLFIIMSFKFIKFIQNCRCFNIITFITLKFDLIIIIFIYQFLIFKYIVIIITYYFMINCFNYSHFLKNCQIYKDFNYFMNLIYEIFMFFLTNWMYFRLMLTFIYINNYLLNLLYLYLNKPNIWSNLLYFLQEIGTFHYIFLVWHFLK